jgi:hypothetical protein
VIIALYAAVAMVIEDVLGVLLTQAQARNRASLAGWLDTAAWLAGILTTTWSLNAINGHNTALKVVVVAAVSAANFVGSWSGTKLGERWIKAPAPLAAQVADHDRRLSDLEAR